MKTIFLKRFIPVLIFGLAIVGAFATNINKESTVSTNQVQGFVKLNALGTTCDAPEMCSTESGVICTVGNNPNAAQLWGKNSSGRCIVELYRIP